MQPNPSPLPREFVTLADTWCGALSHRLLDVLWRGYVLLRRSRPNTLNREDEREVTQHLVWRVRAAMTGFEPYECEHKPNIEETQQGASAQPPEPDIGFILYSDERVIWPIEAKILKNAADVSAYVAEVNDNFITGRYTALSSQGALLGYLLSGKASAVFQNLETALECPLEMHPVFPRRPQRMSKHNSVYVPKRSPFHMDRTRKIVCHHMILPI